MRERKKKKKKKKCECRHFFFLIFFIFKKTNKQRPRSIFFRPIQASKNPNHNFPSIIHKNTQKTHKKPPKSAENRRFSVQNRAPKSAKMKQKKRRKRAVFGEILSPPRFFRRKKRCFQHQNGSFSQKLIRKRQNGGGILIESPCPTNGGFFFVPHVPSF
jgi:hypothetical protein